MNLKTRVIIFLIVFLVLSGILAYSSTIQLSPSDAQSLTQSAKNIDESVVGIFKNNVQIALLEFVPGFGPGFSVYNSYDTGLVLPLSRNPIRAAPGLQGSNYSSLYFSRQSIGLNSRAIRSRWKRVSL